MFDDSSDKDRKRKSLPSRGEPASRPASRGGSLLAISVAPEEDGPVARHRLARSRREATPGPLLAALAQLEGARVEPAARESAEEPKKSRWSLREFLSPKLKYDPPGPKSADAAKPVVVEVPKEGRADRSAAKSGESPRQQAAARWEANLTGAPATRQPAEPLAATASRSKPREAWHVEAPDEIGGGDVAVDDPASNDAHWRPLVDPMRVIGGVINSKMLIITATVIGGLLGVAIALSTPKKYEAFSELLVDPRDLKVSDRDLTQTGLTSDALLALVENQVRLLTSGTVLNKVVDKLKLEDDPEFNGQRKAGGIGNVIASLRALLSRSGGGGEDNRRVTAVENLARALSVERSGRTFIVTVGATTEDAQKSALIVNTVDQVFLETSGELQSDTAGRAADELNARLEELRASVEEAERKVETFKAEHDLIGAQGRLISDDELVRLNEQLATARAQTIELNARAQSVRSIRADSVIGGGLPEEVSSPVMSELRAQYASIKQEADRLSVRLGPRHPQYLAAQAQLQGAREQIENELRRIVASVQTQLKRAVQLEQDLAARLAQLKVRSGDVNTDMVTLRELEREATAKRAVYENYLLRAREAGEQRGINTANISVISQAFPPLDPTGPSRATISMAGAVLGFMAGIGLGMARGILWSLRDKSHARRSRLQLRSSAAGGTAASAGRSANPGASEDEAALEAFDAASNPLARLIERMRRPARTESGEKPATVLPTGASAATTSSNFKPETEIAGRDARASEEAASMYPHPQPTYPQQQPTAYPQQAFVRPASYAQQVAPQPQPYYPQTFAPPQPYPPAFAPQPAAYPYPAAMPPQPAFHGWQAQPATTPFGYPQPVASPYPPYPQTSSHPYGIRPADQPASAPSSRDMSPIEEVRESLREFREAIRDLVEDRARRRHS